MEVDQGFPEAMCLPKTVTSSLLTGQWCLAQTGRKNFDYEQDWNSGYFLFVE